MINDCSTKTHSEPNPSFLIFLLDCNEELGYLGNKCGENELYLRLYYNLFAEKNELTLAITCEVVLRHVDT